MLRSERSEGAAVSDTMPIPVGRLDVLDPEIAAREFPLHAQTLRYILTGLKRQKKNAYADMESVWSNWSIISALLPLMGFLSTVAVGVSQINVIREQPVLSALASSIAIFAACAVTALSTWSSARRLPERYASFFSTYFETGKLLDLVEFQLLRFIESDRKSELTSTMIDSGMVPLRNHEPVSLQVRKTRA